MKTGDRRAVVDGKGVMEEKDSRDLEGSRIQLAGRSCSIPARTCALRTPPARLDVESSLLLRADSSLPFCLSALSILEPKKFVRRLGSLGRYVSIHLSARRSQESPWNKNISRQRCRISSATIEIAADRAASERLCSVPAREHTTSHLL